MNIIKLKIRKKKTQYENTRKLDRVASPPQIKEIPQCAYVKVEWLQKKRTKIKCKSAQEDADMIGIEVKKNVSAHVCVCVVVYACACAAAKCESKAATLRHTAISTAVSTTYIMHQQTD